ncbi:MAG: hypothetical protein ABIR96_09945 [Bdellovibrionota bacterium]
MSQEGKGRDAKPNPIANPKIASIRSLADDLEASFAEVTEKTRILSEERAYLIQTINDVKLEARSREHALQARAESLSTSIQAAQQKFAAMQSDLKIRTQENHVLSEAVKALDADKKFLESMGHSLQTSLKNKVSAEKHSSLTTRETLNALQNECNELKTELGNREAELQKFKGNEEKLRKSFSIQYTELERRLAAELSRAEVARIHAAQHEPLLEETRNQLAATRNALTKSEAELAAAREKAADTRLAFEQNLNHSRSELLERIRDLEINLAAAQSRESLAHRDQAMTHKLSRALQEKTKELHLLATHESKRRNELQDRIRDLETSHAARETKKRDEFTLLEQKYLDAKAELSDAQAMTHTLDAALRNKREENAQLSQRVHFLEFEKLVTDAEEPRPTAKSRLEVVSSPTSSLVERKIEPNG